MQASAFVLLCWLLHSSLLHQSQFAGMIIPPSQAAATWMMIGIYPRCVCRVNKQPLCQEHIFDVPDGFTFAASAHEGNQWHIVGTFHYSHELIFNVLTKVFPRCFEPNLHFRHYNSSCPRTVFSSLLTVSIRTGCIRNLNQRICNVRFSLVLDFLKNLGLFWYHATTLLF